MKGNSVIYPSNFETKLGFDKVREHVRELCISSMGRQKVEEIRFSSFFEDIHKQLEQVSEFVYLHQFESDFPLDFITGIGQSLDKLTIP